MKSKLKSKTTRLFTIPTLAIALATSVISLSKANANVSDSLLPAEIQGEWLYGRISSVQYEDITTREIKSTNGTSDRFKLDPNGNYQRVRLLKITTYNCASYLFISDKGKVKVEGERVTFQPTESLTKGQSCNEANSYEHRNATKPESYNWSIEKDSNGQSLLVFKGLDGKGQSLYNRPR
ncbi:hypothetical protein NIES2101_43560 [Calothrix sp. HK-06]|nr:hypothetical protein NIES2101_43560 [Calothrix sp. HK-06]